MNVVTPDIDHAYERDRAERALGVLRAWAAQVDPVEVAALDPAIARLLPDGQVPNYPMLARKYPDDFAADETYRQTLPDLQNGPSSLIKGARRRDPARGYFELSPADPVSNPPTATS